MTDQPGGLERGRPYFEQIGVRLRPLRSIRQQQLDEPEYDRQVIAQGVE